VAIGFPRARRLAARLLAVCLIAGLALAGFPFPSEAELARDALLRLGLPSSAINMLPEPTDNTAEEAG
jgi:hypothetical protein